MATRSRIAIENKNGTVSSVYCHWDGYPDHNGSLLLNHYRGRKKVQDLINLGSISSLSENLIPNEGEDHTFQNPAPNTVVAYCRDRGEALSIDSHASRNCFLKSDVEEYGYLFTLEGTWLLVDGHKNQREFLNLEEVVKPKVSENQSKDLDDQALEFKRQGYLVSEYEPTGGLNSIGLLTTELGPIVVPYININFDSEDNGQAELISQLKTIARENDIDKIVYRDESMIIDVEPK